MKVGASKGTYSYYTYKDVVFDDEGWADATFFLPADYDLVSMLCSSGCLLSGWSVGTDWEGLRYKKEKHKIIAWKRKKEDKDAYFFKPEVSLPRTYKIARFLGNVDDLDEEI